MSDDDEGTADTAGVVPIGVKLGSTRTVIALPDEHGTDRPAVRR